MEREKGAVGLIESISKILIACRAKGEILAKDKSCTRMLFCLVVVKESLNEFAT